MTEPASWHIVNQVKALSAEQVGKTKVFGQGLTLANLIDELLEAGIPPKVGTSEAHPVIGFLNNWVFQRERGYWEGFGPDFGWGFRRTFSDKEIFNNFARVLGSYNFRTSAPVPASFVRTLTPF